MHNIAQRGPGRVFRLLTQLHDDGAGVQERRPGRVWYGAAVVCGEGATQALPRQR